VSPWTCFCVCQPCTFLARRDGFALFVVTEKVVCMMMMLVSRQSMCDHKYCCVQIVLHLFAHSGAMPASGRGVSQCAAPFPVLWKVISNLRPSNPVGSLTKGKMFAARAVVRRQAGASLSLLRRNDCLHPKKVASMLTRAPVVESLGTKSSNLPWVSGSVVVRLLSTMPKEPEPDSVTKVQSVVPTQSWLTSKLPKWMLKEAIVAKPNFNR
jgi:hypothetical protein